MHRNPRTDHPTDRPATRRRIALAWALCVGALVGALGADVEPSAAEEARVTRGEMITIEWWDWDWAVIVDRLTAVEADRADGVAFDGPLQNAAQCPGSGAVPAQATNHTMSAADVDGDGDADTLHGYVVDGQGHVQVSFTGGGGSVLMVDPGDAPMVAPRPSLGHDLDGDGDEEFTARIAGGIGGVTHALFEVDGCALQLVTLDEAPAELHHRETIGARSGFMCTHEEGNRFLHVWDLQLLAADQLDEPHDGDVYGGTRSMYRLLEGELVLQSVNEAYEIPGEYELGAGSTCTNLLAT